MSKLIASLIVATAALSAPAGAAILGPHAAACATAGKPAMLVRVTGLKARGGTIRVQLYGGDPRAFFDKGSYIDRVDVEPPASGPVEICMPVPRAGIYAISVRHQLGGGTEDGGGMSGNPNLSLMDVLFKRKPSPAQVSVEVRGRTIVPVVLNYVQGASVRPIATAE